MRQIDDSHVRRDAQHHSFADRNGVIIGAEIRHEDNRAQTLGMSLIRPPRLSGWRRVGRLAVDAAGREKHSHEREHDDNPPPNTSAFPAARSQTRRPLEMPQTGSVPEMYWSRLRAHTKPAWTRDSTVRDTREFPQPRLATHVLYAARLFRLCSRTRSSAP
jgi:hypothetical protein